MSALNNEWKQSLSCGPVENPDWISLVTWAKGLKATLFWMEDYFQPVQVRSNKPTVIDFKMLNNQIVSVSVLMTTLKSASYFKSTFNTLICIQCLHNKRLYRSHGLIQLHTSTHWRITGLFFQLINSRLHSIF